MVANMIREVKARVVVLLVDDAGMSTVEYAIGTIAAAAFGAILYTVVTGDSIVTALDEHHQSGAEHQRLTGDRGATTIEAAFAIAALVVVLLVCMAGLTAVSMQVRCIYTATSMRTTVCGKWPKRPRTMALHAWRWCRACWRRADSTSRPR